MTASPAIAASNCEPEEVTLDWGTNYARVPGTARGEGTATSASGREVTYTVGSTFGELVGRWPSSNSAVGGRLMIKSDVLELVDDVTQRDPRFEDIVTIEFAAPVQDLRFSIYDIDGTYNRDYVSVPDADVLRVGAALRNDSGTFSPADPAGAQASDQDPDYAVDFHFPGETSSFTIVHTALAANANGQQNPPGVFLSAMTFTLLC